MQLKQPVFGFWAFSDWRITAPCCHSHTCFHGLWSVQPLCVSLWSNSNIFFLSGKLLVPIVWKCLKQLEAIGFKVIALTSDSASSTASFFQNLLRKSVVCRTTNIYSHDKHPLFFYIWCTAPYPDCTKLWVKLFWSQQSQIVAKFVYIHIEYSLYHNINKFTVKMDIHAS